jgi:hypothetical protein
MADAVLANLENWCETNIFRQRETGDDSSGAIYRVFDAVEQYFVPASVCASSERWLSIPAGIRSPIRYPPTLSSGAQLYRERSSDQVSRSQMQNVSHMKSLGGIQGAIVLSRALNQTGIFSDSISSLKSHCRT